MARGYRLGDIHPTEEEIMPEPTPCGCGRSTTGLCTGLHEMSEEEYETYLLDHFDQDPDEVGP